MIAIRVVVLALVFGACAPRTWHPADHPSATSLFDYSWLWIDDTGARVSFAQLRGKPPVVLALLYTSCEETCPRTLVQLRDLYAKYTREHTEAEFVIVTIDPGTDTPTRLHEYRKEMALPAPWHLWAGGSAETRELAELLGVHLMDMDTHTVHDSKVVLFDGNGRSVSVLDVL